MRPQLICKKVDEKTGEKFPTKKEIASFADRLLNDYCRKFNRTLETIDHDELISKYLGLDIQYQRLSRDKSILGATIQKDGFIETYNDDGTVKLVKTKRSDIFIDSEACCTIERELFTIYHEIKHYLLDLDKDFKVDKIIDDRKVIDEQINSKTAYGWAEYFANYFSVCMLLSRRRIKKLYEGKYDKYFSNYHTKMCKRRIVYLRAIIREISQETGCSKSAVAIRLKELKLITNDNFKLLDYKFGKEAVLFFKYNNTGGDKENICYRIY